MGQISMEIKPLPGSLPGGNQQVFLCGKPEAFHSTSMSIDCEMLQSSHLTFHSRPFPPRCNSQTLTSVVLDQHFAQLTGTKSQIITD